MFKRCLSVLLSVASVTCVLTELASSSSATTQEPVEIISKRSEYEKHYDNGDGTITAFVNTDPFHYYDNGKWVEIDNTLVCDDNGNYTNKSNSMNVTLAPAASVCSVDSIDGEQMVTIEYDDYTIAWDLVNEQPEITAYGNTSIPVSNISLDAVDDKSSLNLENYEMIEKAAESVNNLESSVTYNSFYNNVDVKVDVKPSSVKGTIILNNPNTVPEQFTYYIKVNELNAQIYEDNSVHFLNKFEEDIFTIPAIFMFDSSENIESSHDVEIEIEDYEDGYLLTLIPDSDWLESTEIVYPVTIDPEIININGSESCSYIKENAPNDSFSDQLLKVGGSYSNHTRAESFLFFPENFINYNPTTEIIDAECNIYITTPNGPGSLPDINVNLINTEPFSRTWNTAGEGRLPSTNFGYFEVTSNFIGYQKIDITGLAQTWLNYAKTSQQVGRSNYGINLSMRTPYGECCIVNMFSPRFTYSPPYFKITYTTDAAYSLNYAPYKYNNRINYINNIYTINNFQNRMNCYAYALQTYYKGYLNSGENYKLYPGEFGISRNPNIDTYSQLTSAYEEFSSNSTVFANFVEARMMEDAETLNYSLTKINTQNEFNLPNDFNESNERIIAMVTGESLWGTLDYHFYVRNGNGTCPNGHGDNCSMWSHKQGNSEISNKAINTSAYLCDQNIQYTAKYGYTNVIGPYFYRISKDVYLYNSWHGDGRAGNSTGTPYCQ